MRCSLVVAMARNGVIGRANRLPWHLPADLAHFKRTTLGAPVIMGRKTWESIGRALPGRTNIVISSRADYAADGGIVAPSLERALAAAGDVPEAFVIGGELIFAQALPRASRIHLTEIDADIEGDTHFPAFDRGTWRETLLGSHAPDERNAFPMRFLLLERP
jgi:dihydrofolate reductase